MDVGELSDRPRDGTADSGGAIGGGVIGRGADSNGNGAADATSAEAARQALDVRAPAGDRTGSPGAASPDGMQAEIATLKHEVTHLSSSLGHERDRTRTLESNLAAKDGRIGQLEYLMADLNADNARLGHEKDDLSRAVTTLMSRVDALQTEVSALKAREARRDELDARRDSAIATATWYDVLHEERFDAVEAAVEAKPARKEHESKDQPALDEVGDRTLAKPEQQGDIASHPMGWSTEAISFYAATGVGILTPVSLVLREVPAEIATVGASIIGMAAAGIAWIRKVREDRNAHRSQG